MGVSKNFSLSGWNWRAWLKGNKEAVKLLIAALFGLWVPATPELKVVSGAALKLCLDVIDYWVSEVKN